MMTAIFLALMGLIYNPPEVPRTSWLAECSHWPITDGQTVGDVTQVSSTIGADLSIILSKGKHLYAITGWRLGSREAGWYIYSMTGPKAFMEALGDHPAICRATLTYKEAWSAGTAVRNWIAARSTCLGKATLQGREYTSWPCRWTTERAGEGFAVQSYTGIGQIGRAHV